MTTQKSPKKQIFRTPYKKADKRNCKTADQVILEWFQSHGNVTRSLSNGSLTPKQFRFTKEIWLAINKQSSPPRPYASVWTRLHRWLRAFQQAGMMAKEGSSKRAIKKVFPYYYDLMNHINHQPSHRQRKKGVIISSSDNDLHEAVTDQEALVPSSSLEVDTKVPSNPTSQRQTSPSSLPPPPPQIIIPYKPMPAIYTTSSDSNDDDEGSEQEEEVDEENEEEQQQGEREEQDIENTQLADNDDRMKIEMMQLLQKNYDYILSVSRTQEMERKASLIRTMRDAGFSKDEIMSILNTM